jgi:AmmeMemoRadiSam system protein B
MATRFTGRALQPAEIGLAVLLATAGCAPAPPPQPPPPQIPKKVRQPAVAYPPVAFYEGNPDKLKAQVDECCEKAEKHNPKGRLVAAVVPHAGYGFSGRCAGSVYRLIEAGDYDRVIILGPYHGRGPGPHFRGISLPENDITHHRTPLGDVPLDLEACSKLVDNKGFAGVAGTDRREHSLEVQLPFLQRRAGDFELVPLLCDVITDEQIDGFAEAIAPLVDDRTLILASSDFTHYGPNFGFIPFRDNVKATLDNWLEEACGLIAGRDLEGFSRHCTDKRDTICGRIPVKILLATLNKLDRPPEGKVLDMYLSGDLSKNYANSVSYGAVGFFDRSD